MSKKKIQLTPQLDVDEILKTIKSIYSRDKKINEALTAIDQQETKPSDLVQEINTIDGVKIDFADNWVHLRKSNTEPIIRIYTEALSQNEADALADRFIKEIETIANL